MCACVCKNRIKIRKFNNEILKWSLSKIIDYEFIIFEIYQQCYNELSYKVKWWCSFNILNLLRYTAKLLFRRARSIGIHYVLSLKNLCQFYA